MSYKKWQGAKWFAIELVRDLKSNDGKRSWRLAWCMHNGRHYWYATNTTKRRSYIADKLEATTP